MRSARAAERAAGGRPRLGATEGAFRRLCGEERGAVTAEFAVVLPAVLAVLGISIAGVFIAAQRLSLVSLAAQLARFEARGDEDLAAAMLADWAGPPLEAERERSGALHCVVLRSHPAGGLLSAIAVETRACAAVAGEESVPGSAAVAAATPAARSLA
ncbi:TadE/TadG family type IV pilus assembly protein [Leucobacter massiliensis]|uniref:TadE/TadG family type IV pilus assembly protein n=1 Tax=Leucobacter massiliensis TaxID=1686285 RepID=UPI001FEA9E30|nr:pilus assembly protein [Leucobacter massiliensis]